MTTRQQILQEITGTLIRQWRTVGFNKEEFRTDGSCMAFGSDGLLYMTDCYNHRIQVFCPDGTYVRGWGSKGSTLGEMWYPQSIAAATTSDILYVLEYVNNRVQVFRRDGVAVACWDQPFVSAHSIVSDQHHVYATDRQAHRVIVFDHNGRVMPTGFGSFFSPTGITVDGEDHVVYVSECGKHCILAFSTDGALVRKWGSYGADDAEFNGPMGIVFALGLLYVADCWNSRVQIFRADGSFVRNWRTQGPPDGLAMGPDGSLYVHYYYSVLVFS